MLLTFPVAFDKRIAVRKILGTCADRIVSNHMAPRVYAATVHAGVYALEVDAGSVGGAVGVDDALGAAAGRRARVAGPARARRAVVRHVALAVGPARGRLAWVHWCHCIKRTNCNINVIVEKSYNGL